jgi:hypothetical protein
MGRARLRDGPARQPPGGANLRHDWNNQVHVTSKLMFLHAKKFLKNLPQFGHATSKILGQKSVKNIGLKGPQITVELSNNVTHKRHALCHCNLVSL